MESRVRDALNDATDTLEALRMALDEKDAEDIEDTFADLEEAVQRLKVAIGLSPPQHGPETS